jgi:hypothetical protein
MKQQGEQQYEVVFTKDTTFFCLKLMNMKLPLKTKPLTIL